MNYETIRNIAKNCHENRHPYPGACVPYDYRIFLLPYAGKGKGAGIDAICVILTFTIYLE